MEMYTERQATATAEEEEEEEDRISDLPDCMLHHILSFLPSTKEAIQTSILSKRWLHQWIHVPVLIFNNDHGDMSYNNFLNFVDNTLIRHDCSKVRKFHLEYPYCVKKDPKFDAKILFATRKHVEELYLSCYWQHLLPLSNSILMLDRKVNWGCLAQLNIHRCKLTDQGLQHILSGSPLLKSFELINCVDFVNLVIASKSLKKLVVQHDIVYAKISSIEISCPNLVELSLFGVEVVGEANLFGQAFANFLSTSPLLESLELIWIDFPLPHDQLVIASKSLKKLVINLNYNIFHLHLSCPQLELLVLYGWFNLRTTKLLDLPSSLCATFAFHYEYDDVNSICKTLVQDILQQVHHVKQLTIGILFIRILSTLGVGDPFPSVLNIKSLTLNSPNLNKHYSGIARLLRHAPELEKLVINAPKYDQTKLETLDDFGENFWNRDDGVVFNCLVSHLKTVRIIIGFSERHDELKPCLISLVQFLLKNARVLEKLIVITKLDRTDVSLRTFQKLLDLPRCSKHAIVELVYS